MRHCYRTPHLRVPLRAAIVCGSQVRRKMGGGEGAWNTSGGPPDTHRLPPAGLSAVQANAPPALHHKVGGQAIPDACTPTCICRAAAMGRMSAEALHACMQPLAAALPRSDPAPRIARLCPQPQGPTQPRGKNSPLALAVAIARHQTRHIWQPCPPPAPFFGLCGFVCPRRSLELNASQGG